MSETETVELPVTYGVKFVVGPDAWPEHFRDGTAAKAASTLYLPVTLTFTDRKVAMVLAEALQASDDHGSQVQEVTVVRQVGSRDVVQDYVDGWERGR